MKFYVFAAVLTAAAAVPYAAFCGISTAGEGKPGVRKTVVPANYGIKYGIRKAAGPAAKDSDTDTAPEISAKRGYVLRNSGSSYTEVSYVCTEKSEDIRFCLGENDKPLDGKVAEEDGSGGYASIENYKNGYRDGLCTYFKEGDLSERTYYKSGVKNGMSKLYYSRNIVKISATYKDGKLDGIADVYLPDGSLAGRMKYKKGVLVSGYCKTDGQKKNFSYGMLKNYPENTLNGCGVSL